MKARLYDSINGALKSTRGIMIQRTGRPTLQEVVDLRADGLDPLEARYLLPGHPHLVDVPTSRCRVFPPIAFRCERGSGSPFIDTVIDYIETGHREYDDSALQAYYERWQPSTARDVVGLDSEDGRLASSHPDEWFLPWRNPESSVLVGASRGKGIGRKEWGPVTAERGEREMRRLISLYESIRTDGYNPGGQHCYVGRSEILVHGDDYAVLIYGGQHRASTLGAMGFESVPVCFSEQGRPHYWLEVVHRVHVSRWPRVMDGSFSPESALYVFDRLFEGKHPAETVLGKN